ncbi:hypothetical protein M1D96_06605 [Pseudomonas sp. D1-3]
MDNTGRYIGGFDTPPDDLIEVTVLPEHAAQRWDGLKWVSPAASKSDQLAANNMAYSTATLAMTADYPQLEKDTWPTQNEQAAAWVADPEGAVTPWIDMAARERGIDREEYLRRTLVKADQFKILSAFLTGRRQRYEDEIKAGGDPVLDYALTPAVLAQLQQVAIDGMSLPAAELRGVL